MKRKDFLRSVGQGIIITCAGACLSQCSTGDSPSGNNNPPASGEVSANLSAIPNIGDQTAKNGVLFIRIAEGSTSSSFIATEAFCPHQGGQLVWLDNEDIIQCQLHFAEFQPDGDVLQGPQGSSGNVRKLQVYSTNIASGVITASVS